MVRRIASKLTYANVVATLALVLAVGGGATAIAMSLPKNSVKSKQIAKGAVTTKKIAKDAVTGEQVKESTLAKVPSAAHADSADTATKATSADSASVATSLAGLNTAELGKTQTASGEFGVAEDLALKVAGFGRFFVQCIPNSPNPNDDEPDFGYSSSMPAGSLESGFYMTAPAPFSSPTTEIVAGPVSDGASSTFGEAPAIFIDFTAVIPGGKSVTVRGGAFDNTAPSRECEGTLQATVNG